MVEVEALKYNFNAHKAALTSAKVGMRKADFKKLLAALDEWEDDSGENGGFCVRDKITWKGEVNLNMPFSRSTTRSPTRKKKTRGVRNNI